MHHYKDMLERIKQYRKNVGLQQSHLGDKLEISQEAYSYIENGESKISYEAMMVFDNMGLSVNKLVTGKEYPSECREFEEAIATICDENRREWMLKLVAELILICLKRDIYLMKDTNSIELLQYTVKFWDEFSMIRIVRAQQGCSQMVLAEKMGVSIKKYRKLEREIRYPDAEILLRLYAISGYEPALFVRKENRKELIMMKAWRLLVSEDKKRVKEFIKYLNLIFEQ